MDGYGYNEYIYIYNAINIQWFFLGYTMVTRYVIYNGGISWLSEGVSIVMGNA